MKENPFKKCPVCGLPFVSCEIEAEPDGYTKNGLPASFVYSATMKCCSCDNTFIVHGRNRQQLEEHWKDLCSEIRSKTLNGKQPFDIHGDALSALSTLITYTHKRDCRKCIFCVGQKDGYYIDGRCALPDCPQLISASRLKAISERAQALRADTCDR